MQRSSAYYVITAILFGVCVIVNLISMMNEAEKADEILLHRSKRSIEDAFIEEALAEHNRLREKHGSPPLVVDKALCTIADSWAQKMVEDSEKNGKITMVHSKTKDTGENIGVCKCKEWTAVKASNAWYDEVKKHNWSDNMFNVATGHFTQLIWKDTKTFCIARSSNGKFGAVVAHYQPRGNANYRSSFAANVLPPKE